ncbi:ATP-dependent Clp protease ATP-binding subunit [Actinoplanes sp. LDG1-06]|uniref:ATP-dependent Clp protease ATP-binding subunit n=1 Tax=Paractinoplanes ovalisporus TaxID=2810368 RepID=A0ABS2AV18_9ACTN|nr:Clp protease N-terminal domain-containing protein [Actinoplanes ovalisporus]MBM2623717.1 ATP-dependent Clp protease ATP-binding subunit [Actinoplanes ovalisporus]
MPKINVYLPDDLADSVRESGIPVSAICQRALEQAVQRVTAIRSAILDDLDEGGELIERLPSFTARLVTVLKLAAARARVAGAPTVTTGDLLHGMLAEGDNLALQILTAMDVAPTSLTAPTGREPGGSADEGLRFSRPAAIALEQAVGEAIGFGHNYVGCEHLLVALAGEQDGVAGKVLRERGVDAKATRRAVSVAIAGYAHLRANLRRQGHQPGTADMAGILTAVRAELAPLVTRLEQLEARIS